MKREEINQRLNELHTTILDCESKLSSTDYIAAKIAEGKATQEEYATKISDRQEWRNRINLAKDEIARLEGIEPEEEEAPEV